MQYNIIKTINTFKKLLNLSEQKILENTLDKSLNKLHKNFLNFSEKLLRSYYKDNRDYKDFNELCIMECIIMLNIFWKELYNEYIFPSHSL